MHKEIWYLQREVTSYCDFAILIDILEKNPAIFVQPRSGMPKFTQKHKKSKVLYFFFLCRYFIWWVYTCKCMLHLTEGFYVSEFACTILILEKIYFSKNWVKRAQIGSNNSYLYFALNYVHYSLLVKTLCRNLSDLIGKTECN